MSRTPKWLYAIPACSAIITFLLYNEISLAYVTSIGVWWSQSLGLVDIAGSKLVWTVTTVALLMVSLLVHGVLLLQKRLHLGEEDLRNRGKLHTDLTSLLSRLHDVTSEREKTAALHALMARMEEAEEMLACDFSKIPAMKKLLEEADKLKLKHAEKKKSAEGYLKVVELVQNDLSNISSLVKKITQAHQDVEQLTNWIHDTESQLKGMQIFINRLSATSQKIRMMRKALNDPLDTGQTLTQMIQELQKEIAGFTPANVRESVKHLDQLAHKIEKLKEEVLTPTTPAFADVRSAR